MIITTTINNNNNRNFVCTNVLSDLKADKILNFSLLKRKWLKIRVKEKQKSKNNEQSQTTQNSYLVLCSNLFLIMQCQGKLLWSDYYKEDEINPSSSLVLFVQVKRGSLVL